MKIEKEYSGANTPRTIRFTEKLFYQLHQVAAENNISFNLVVLQCCKYALDHYDHTDI